MRVCNVPYEEKHRRLSACEVDQRTKQSTNTAIVRDYVRNFFALQRVMQLKAVSLRCEGIFCRRESAAFRMSGRLMRKSRYPAGFVSLRYVH